MLLTKKLEKELKNEKIISAIKEDKFVDFSNLLDITTNPRKIGLLTTMLLSSDKKIVCIDNDLYVISTNKDNKATSYYLYGCTDKKDLELDLKQITEYKEIDSFNVFSDVSSVCINGLNIKIGCSDGIKTVKIRKNLSNTSYPIPKASCYEVSQCFFPINHKIAISQYDCEVENVRIIDNVISVWVCDNNKVYVYVK